MNRLVWKNNGKIIESVLPPDSIDWYNYNNEWAKYFPEVKSVISVGLNYYSGRSVRNSEKSGISNYAWGDDYHDILKEKLYESLKRIKQKIPIDNYRVCVDTSPVMDKAWAQKSGIGWIGKHTNLITRYYGSWIFLGELLLDVELEYDTPFDDDLCGTCTACLDACPTDAFPEPYVLDSNKCISYLTIEHRGDLPTELENKLSGWIYGCDICQEVCPWNITFSQLSNENSFKPRENLQERPIPQWEKLTEEDFRILFKKSAVKRTKYIGLKRNISVIEKNNTNNLN